MTSLTFCDGVTRLSCSFAEHCGRYEYIAQALTAEGFVVLAMDHQGHGQSEGDRAHVRAFDDYVDDYIQYVNAESKEYEGSGIPMFLVVRVVLDCRPVPCAFIALCIMQGHSMGGTIASLVASRTSSLWRGVVLSGAGVFDARNEGRLLSSYPFTPRLPCGLCVFVCSVPA